LRARNAFDAVVSRFSRTCDRRFGRHHLTTAAGAMVGPRSQGAAVLGQAPTVRLKPDTTDMVSF